MHSNKEKTEIPLDTSFFNVEDDKITFSVNKVKPSEIKSCISAKSSFEDAIKQLSNYPKGELTTAKFEGVGKIQDISYKREPEKSFSYVKVDTPTTIGAISYAFANHVHLELSPSDFIILIGQGLANHINNNSEKLRHHFVDHDGKEKIIILTNELKLDEKSDWSVIFEQFCEEIKKRVKKDVYNIVIDDTSVATPTTRICSELNLMDCMKNYFDYIVKCICGFPKITLKGTTDDWKKLLEKVEKLAELNGKNNELELDWWLKNLLPITQKICEAGIDRKVDHEFWSNLYQESKVYGGQSIRGWINAFIPYVNNYKGGYAPNQNLEKGFVKGYVYEGGISHKDIREGITQVPFLYECGNKKVPMHFYSGFLGARYDKAEKIIAPAYFWCVAQDN